MKLNILFRTSENRGDHATDCAIAIEAFEHESVGDLVERVQALRSFDGSDLIEIRLVQEPKR